MCKDLYKLTKGGTDAWTLKHEAAKLGITVRYRTDLSNGLIKGVSFERNGIRFQGGKLDRSLAASKILPLEQQTPLTAQRRSRLMTLEVERLLKAGGVAPDINNHKVKEPTPPLAPNYRMSKNMAMEYRIDQMHQRQQKIQQEKERQLEQQQTQQQEVRKSRGIKM